MTANSRNYKREGGVYISGPMRGYPQYNFPAFYAAEEWLRANKFEGANDSPIFNPARKDEESGFSTDDEVTPEFLQKAMRWDIEKVLESRMIVLLPGWAASEGAKLELAVARSIGVRVAELIYQDGEPDHLWFSSDADLDNAIEPPGPYDEFKVPLKHDYGRMRMSPEGAHALGAEIRVVNETTGGAKGQKQARFDLIPKGPLWEVAELYGKGAEKYAERNWELGYDWSLSFGALQRHAWLFWGGESYDQETGKHHMASVAFHAFALMEFGRTHAELDNRPAA